MGRFADILRSGKREGLAQKWAETQAAPDYAPMPAGTYNAYVDDGIGHQAKTGNSSYRLTFKIIDEPFQGRRPFLDLWFSDGSLKSTKRDLIKLDVPTADLATMEAFLDTHKFPPDVIKVKLRIVIETQNDGTQWNKVKSFTVVGRDAPPVNHFAPPPPTAAAAPSAPPPTAEVPASTPADPPAPAPKRRGRPPKQPVETTVVNGDGCLSNANGEAFGGRF